MVAVAGLSVVPNQLPAADDLAHGEESQHLGEQDAAADDLRPREVPYLLDGRGRGRGAGGGAGGGAQKGLGVLDGVDSAVEVALDGGHGTTCSAAVSSCTYMVVHMKNKIARHSERSLLTGRMKVQVAMDLRWLHLLALEDKLAQLEADSAVVDDEGNLA